MARRRSSEVPPLARRREREAQGKPPFPLPFRIQGPTIGLRILLVVGALLGIAFVGGMLAHAAWRGLGAAALFIVVVVAPGAMLAIQPTVILDTTSLRIHGLLRRREVPYEHIEEIEEVGDRIGRITLEDGHLFVLLMKDATHRRVVVQWLRSQVHASAFE